MTRRSDYHAAVALFEALLDAPAEQVASALHAAPPEIAREVRAMLAADAAPSQLDLSDGGLSNTLAIDLLQDQPPPARVGPFTVGERIGSGGMGSVYRATQAHPRREVALKLLHPWMCSAEGRERFRFEAQALARITHPGIPVVHAAGEEDGRPWIAMELLEGHPLTASPVVARMSPRERTRLLASLCDAVGAGHAAGLVHRDLKPHNVLVTPQAKVKVLDFGISAAIDGQTRAAKGGTPRWASPEQLSQAPPTPASDVYALGRLGQALLALPGPVQPPHPVDLPHVLHRAVDPDPQHRHPDASALARDLRATLDDRPIDALTDRPGYRARTWARRHRRSLRAAAIFTGASAVALTTVLAKDAWDARHLERAANARLHDVRTWADAAVAQGQHAAARDAVDALQRLPEQQGTTAYAQGWQLAARVAAAAGDETSELDHLARAVVASPSQGSLLSLSVALHRSWRWDAAAATLAHAAAHGPIDPALHTQVLVGAGDLEGAARIAPVTERAFLRALAAQTVTSLSGGSLTAARDHTGELHAILHVEPPRTLRWLGQEPALPVQALSRLPEGHILSPAPGAIQHAGRTLVWHEDPNHNATAWHVAPDAPPQIIPNHPALRVLSATVEPGDGAVWVGAGPFQRDIQRLTLTPYGWRAFSPVPWLDELRSDVHGLLFADTRGDGEPELWVGHGPWQGYGVHTALRDGREWRPGGSLTLGFTHFLTSVHTAAGTLVGALQSTRYHHDGIEGLPSDPPSPLGLWWLRQGSAGIEVVDRLTPPTAPGAETRVGLVAAFPGDFDGDGLTDLAVWMDDADRSATWLLHQRPDGSFQRYVIGDRMPLLAADLDGDGDDELVLLSHPPDGPIVVHGAGSPPTAPPSTAESTPPPPGLHPESMRQAWRDATFLASIGLVDAAIHTLQRASLAVGEPGSTAHLLHLAATLAFDRDHFRRAADLARDAAASASAAGDAALATTARKLQVQAATADFDFAAASRAARSIAASPAQDDDDIQLAERLSAIAEAPSTTLLHDPESTVVHASDALRVRANGDILLNVHDAHGPLAEAHLTTAAAGVSLRFSWDPVDVDYGATSDLTLHDERGLALRMTLHGDSIARPKDVFSTRLLTRWKGDMQETHHHVHRAAGPVDVELSSHDGRLRVQLRSQTASHTSTMSFDPLGERLTVGLASLPEKPYGYPGSTRMNGTLSGLRVTGAVPRAVTPSPSQRWRFAQLHGMPVDSPAALGPVDRAYDALQRNAADAASALCGLTGLEGERFWIRRLRDRPIQVQPMLLACLGGRFAELYANTWAAPLRHRPDSAVLDRLDPRALDALDLEHPQSLELYARYATALVQLGHWQQARAASDRLSSAHEHMDRSIRRGWERDRQRIDAALGSQPAALLRP